MNSGTILSAAGWASRSWSLPSAWGRWLLKKTKNGIQYSLRALPIGGMCRFYGEDDDAADARCFNAQKAWKRFLVIAAGPI